MATSNSVDFTMTRNEIITDALMAVGAYGQEESIRSEDLDLAARALNRLIKRWENQSIHIWKRSECTLFLQQDQSKYTLGLGSTDHATETYNQTTLSAAEASGQTTLSVSAVTGINVSDYVGVVLDDGSTHWSTVSSIGASTITIQDALTDDASSGAYVWTYTTKINKPLQIYSIRRRVVASNQDIPLNLLSYEDYMNLPFKETNSSTPLQGMYDRKNTTGYLYIWPPVSDATHILKITYAKPLEDFDAASDTPDLPSEWYDALVVSLAASLCKFYPETSTTHQMALRAEAQQLVAEALAFDDEKTYITVSPDNR